MRESTAMFDKTMFKYFSDHHYNIHWSKVTIVLVYKILKSWFKWLKISTWLRT